MTAKEAIGIINIAIAFVEWEYPLDYAAAFDELVNIWIFWGCDE